MKFIRFLLLSSLPALSGCSLQSDIPMQKVERFYELSESCYIEICKQPYWELEACNRAQDIRKNFALELGADQLLLLGENSKFVRGSKMLDQAYVTSLEMHAGFSARDASLCGAPIEYKGRHYKSAN